MVMAGGLVKAINGWARFLFWDLGRMTQHVGVERAYGQHCKRSLPNWMRMSRPMETFMHAKLTWLDVSFDFGGDLTDGVYEF